MRWPSRHEIYYVSWGVAGLGLLFAGIVVVSRASAGLLWDSLGVSSLAVFVATYTFAVTRRLSEFGSRIASGCLIVGWLSVALLPLIQLDSLVYLAVGYPLLWLGIMGFVYIAFVEIPITMPKKPGSSRGGRLLDIGFLLIILGSGIAFVRGFSPPIPRELYVSFFSPLGLTGKVSFITGIVLFSLAVLRARKRYLPDGNRAPLRPTDASDNFASESES
ncbi:MAG TPA: hypothetical protein VNA15_06010 [Candidatus Angelobacter sp.]|nr:hypothetical protein [Candidatus Angelobacter sp.]